MSLMRIDDFVHVLHAARAGSREALGMLVEASRGRLHRLASRHVESELRPKNSPSDLVQDTLLEACCSIRQFKGDSPEQFEAWLTQILFRNVSNFRRSYRHSEKRRLNREVRLSSPRHPAAPTSAPDDQLARDEGVARLSQALNRLPNEDRRILAMRFWERQSFESIGQREHRSAEAARKLCTRAVRRLAQALKDPAR